MLSDLDQLALYRILDANYNRATEGVRTLEELARFRSNSTSLQGQLKSLRHQLAAAYQLLPSSELLKARWAAGDVGPDNTLESEQQRESLTEIQAAAAQRIQQALRCLEEFSKPTHPAASAAFAKVRYLAYDILARTQLDLASHKISFAAARLYVLLDLKRTEVQLLDHGIRMAEAGADVIQIRDKHVDGRMLLERSQKIVEALAETPTRVIINDRPDIALMVGADGVHLGQEDVDVVAVRKLVGKRLAIGLSTHDYGQVAQAELLEIDYIGCGPTFPSSTKQFQEFSGLDFLRQAAVTPLHAFAIGGITLEKLPSVLATGIGRVAVAADIDQATDPYQRIREYQKRLQSN